jgi:hypothetical protein
LREFSVSLSGARIEMGVFLDAVSTAVKLLRAADPDKRIRWRLATLHYGSPAVVGFVGEPRRKDVPPEAADIAIDSVVGGLRALNAGVRPPSFTDDALELAKHLVQVKERGKLDVLTVVTRNGGPPEPLVVTTQMAATVDEVIGIKYESFGSVEGRLEIVSARGQMHCSVYETIHGKPVKCDVPPSLKKAVLDAFDQHVIVYGIVKRDASGQARRIALESVEVVPPSDSVPRSLAGIAPDFTDGDDSAQYIKKRWQ